jgi:hypothetical protein
MKRSEIRGHAFREADVATFYVRPPDFEACPGFRTAVAVLHPGYEELV